MVRISLDAEDFERLVNGEIITRGTGEEVQISLQDIGWDVMQTCLDRAEWGYTKEKGPLYKRQP